MNCSSPFLRSSTKSSSKIPSSDRKGNCRPHALPGNVGTTIYNIDQSQRSCNAPSKLIEFG